MEITACQVYVRSHVHPHTHTYTQAIVYMLEENSWESFLYCPSVGFGVQIQVVGSVCPYLYLLSHLAGPRCMV